MLKFKSVSTKNFGSVGDNPIVIQLDKNPTTAVIGKNGSGKSMLLTEAICFCLFNKSFRGLTKGELINTTNKKGCVIEVELDANGKAIKVVRGIKPDVFTITVDGNDLPETNSKTFQGTLESLLGFDYNLFIRTSILGYANYTPFMSMTTASRREFVEDALNLGVFTEMNKIVKPQLTTINSEFNEATKQVSIKHAVLNEKIAQQKKQNEDASGAINELKSKAKVLIEEIQQLTESSDATKSNLEAQRPQYEKMLGLIQHHTGEICTIDKEISVFEHDSTKISKQSAFYKENSTCPTCNSVMDATHVKSHMNALTQELQTIQRYIADRKQWSADYKEAINAHQTKIDAFIELQTKVDVLDRQINSKKSEAKQLKNLIVSLSVGKTVESLDAFHDEIKTIEANIEELSIKQEEFQIAIELLKDSGIKAKIIEQYIPMFNKTINEYLDVIGIGVRVEFDEEFNERLIGRYADEFSYSSLSQGERSRMNLAIMFAWHDLMGMASGVESSLLVLDEVGSDALDSDGVDAMFAIIESSCINKNVFMISHNAYVQEKCRSQINLKKVDGFTKVML